MFDTRTRTAFWIIILTVSLVYLIELVFAIALGGGLPLPGWYRLVSLGVVILLAAGLSGLWAFVQSRFPHWNRLGRSICFYLSLLIVFSGWYSVAAFSQWFPYFLLFLSVLTAFTLASYHSETGGLFGPLLILVVLALLSPHFYRQIWLYYETFGFLDPPLLALLLLTIAGSGLLGYLGARLENTLNATGPNPRWFAWLTLLVVVFITGTAFFNATPPQWAFTARHTGTLPDVRQTSPSQPNVIIISLDTLRADQLLSAQHRDRFKALQSDGILLDNVVSTSSWTLPAHASFFTGELPHRTGAVTTTSKIESTLPSFVQYLRRVGYQTAAFTDGGYLHKNFGFGRGFGTYWHQTPKRYGDYVPGLTALVSTLLDPFGFGFKHTPVPDSLRGPNRNFVSTTIRRAERWLDTRERNVPFALFLHTYQAHDYWMRFPESMERLRAENPNLAEVLKGRTMTPIGRTKRVSPPLINAYRTLYQYEVQRTASKLESFLQELRVKGLYDNSLVLFLSDHGEAFSVDPLRVGHGKGQLSESLIRVPVLLKLPDNTHAGRRLTTQLSIRDLFPIVLHEIGVTVEGAQQAEFRNLEKLLRNKAAERNIVRGSVFHKESGKNKRPHLFVRSGKYLIVGRKAEETWKYFRVGKTESYQTRVDPSSVPGKTRDRLTSTLRNYASSINRGDNPFTQDRSSTTGRRNMLEGLGYF